MAPIYATIYYTTQREVIAWTVLQFWHYYGIQDLITKHQQLDAHWVRVVL